MVVKTGIESALDGSPRLSHASPQRDTEHEVVRWFPQWAGVLRVSGGRVRLAQSSGPLGCTTAPQWAGFEGCRASALGPLKECGPFQLHCRNLGSGRKVVTSHERGCLHRELAQTTSGATAPPQGDSSTSFSFYAGVSELLRALRSTYHEADCGRGRTR